MRPLVWFRSDLRVRDNTALHHACDRAERGVVGVYLICPEQWREHDWGGMKVDFLLRNLEELSASLSKLNIPLLVRTTPRFSGAPEALDELARRHECDALYFNREYEVNERRRDDDAAELFRERGRAVRAFTDQVALPPGEVRTKQGGWYSVFTPFQRAWIARWNEVGGAPSVHAPNRQRETGIEPDPIPAGVDGFERDDGRPDLWKAGEEHAGHRLEAFIDRRIDSYHTQRDIPSVNGTSTLSPYLSAGVLSPRQCFDAAIDANGGVLPAGGKRPRGKKGPSKWISELIWREFYKHLLVAHPRLSMNQPLRRETERLTWRDDEDGFEAWREGRTGYPIVDAGMRQLNQTGWMHNRLRMIVAMFLTKDLFIDWRRGERHFMNKLVDGDLSSNNGGWQWSASTGADGAPYFRIYNPVSQSRRFDPEGEFIRTFVPELAELDAPAIHEPWTLPDGQRSALGYPSPVCDHATARRRAIEAFESLRDG